MYVQIVSRLSVQFGAPEPHVAPGEGDARFRDEPVRRFTQFVIGAPGESRRPEMTCAKALMIGGGCGEATDIDRFAVLKVQLSLIEAPRRNLQRQRIGRQEPHTSGD